MLLAPSTVSQDRQECHTLYKQNVTRDYIRTVYVRPKITNKARKRIQKMIACQHSIKGTDNTEKYLEAVKKQRKQVQSVTPYRCNGEYWALPCYIIQCESSFQNLSPNYASAAGYYQFLTSTWLSMGGGKYAPRADLATKQEQHIIAARLWAGGANASQWDCSG